METKKLSFMSACKDFFGPKENQTGMDFGREVRTLSPEDRIEITEGLAKLGYEILPTA